MAEGRKGRRRGRDLREKGEEEETRSFFAERERERKGREGEE